ncbi:MAG TPA: outer membrane beta-barrel protein [Vicinamibacterales bacterium]|nr:outer membrane beta-barrel protein [Vicinamibacterales bacterium]
MLRRSSIRGSSTLLITVIVAALGLAAVPAHAQASSAEPSRVEFTLSPGGGIFFQESDAEPAFGNYRLGGGVTVNLTRFVGVEAEVGSSIGISQQVDFGPTSGVARKTPNLLDYSPNLVVSARTGSSVVPYVTGGAGALTVFSREELSIGENETYFTGNVGGGVKWFARSGRWGLRGDYRLLAVRSKSDAPEFFGRDTRYAHRVYGGMIVNLEQ